jgi:hypothetical protein
MLVDNNIFDDFFERRLDAVTILGYIVGRQSDLDKLQKSTFETIVNHLTHFFGTHALLGQAID